MTWAGGPVAYAMCAIDVLGISAMPGRVITVHDDGDQARWDPPGAVVFAGATGGDGCHAADRTCRHINFFTSARTPRA